MAADPGHALGRGRERPLAGTRVLDFCGEFGAYAGRLLADFGADVVRVEPPGGARSRRIPPFHGETSLYFAHRNANKRGVLLDLESGRDRERLQGLCARADVLIESFAPGTLAELGLAPEELMDISYGALLHDVGKTRIPLEIIQKPGLLDKNERRTIESHTTLGAEILVQTE